MDEEDLERLQVTVRRNKAVFQMLCQHMLQRNRTVLALAHHFKRTSMLSPRPWGGSVKGNKHYRRGHSNWLKDYLGTDDVNPTYPPKVFRRRFGIPRTLYKKVREQLLEYNYDVWKTRMIGNRRPGKPTDVKLLNCLRILTTGNCSDQNDDASYVSEETGRLYFKQFCRDVNDVFGETYLDRWPTEAELADIEQQYDGLGFPGCVGALDCMKIFWKNCPFGEKGQRLNSKDSTKLACIQAEAWADHDLYCWHWNVGRPGTNNDINVLTRSRLFKDIITGRFQFKLTEDYEIIPNGRQWKYLYLLTDGIYPDWPMFSKSIKGATDRNVRKFSKLQESVRKDVECLFGVLQSRFEILRREIRCWELDDIISIANTCMILHNMIVRMHMNGDFDDEADGINLITEFYAHDDGERARAAEDYERNRLQNREQVLANWQAEVTRIFIQEQHHTNRRLFKVREYELIRRTVLGSMEED
jgi:hypothetical protein